MSFWDGTRWVDERVAAAPSTSSRRTSWAATAVMILGLVALIVPFSATSAARGNRYPGTLTATPSTLHAGDLFTVTGCGYDTSLGHVIVGFTGGSWGSPLDAKGCFSIAGIPALSGDTLSAGTYSVSAYQYVHRKWTETGETYVTVVP
jgi:hypothetical protein